MNGTTTLEALLQGCADNSFDAGIRIDTELVPLAGPGGPVKPAVYEGGTYQQDRRWAGPNDAEPTAVLVIDNVPSQAQPPGSRPAPGSRVAVDTRVHPRPVRSAASAEATVEPRVPASQRRRVPSRRPTGWAGLPQVAQDYAVAVPWFRRAAEQGNAPGQAALGFMYARGRKVAHDDAEAVPISQRVRTLPGNSRSGRINHLHPEGVATTCVLIVLRRL